MARSKKGRLNWRDMVHGIFVAIGTPLLLGIGDTLQTGTIPTADTIRTLAIAGVGAGVAYIVKQLLTSEHGTIINNKV